MTNFTFNKNANDFVCVLWKVRLLCLCSNTVQDLGGGLEILKLVNCIQLITIINNTLIVCSLLPYLRVSS